MIKLFNIINEILLFLVKIIRLSIILKLKIKYYFKIENKILF